MNLAAAAKHWLSLPARWAYPRLCESCGVRADSSSNRTEALPFLCPDCAREIRPIRVPGCSICGQVYPGELPPNFRCSNCSDRTLEFDFARGGYSSNDFLRNLMHRYKYRGQVHLGHLFGRMLLEASADKRINEKNWIVVPVPLHARRCRERGFNQSSEIAQFWRKEFRPEQQQRPLLIPLLQRIRYTPRQAQLDRKERLQNLKNAFRVVDRHAKKCKTIPDGQLRFLLVDDVLTTGATVSECARTLRQHFDSCQEIAAITVLRG